MTDQTSTPTAPGTEWGIADETSVIDITPSEAQARIEAHACRDMGDATATAVHRTGDGPWTDDDGRTYDQPDGRAVDMLATAGQAANALAWARAMAGRDAADTRWLDALTAEATARGYDIAVLTEIGA
jgi:hypothetical protein